MNNVEFNIIPYVFFLYIPRLMFYHSCMFSSDIMMAEKMDGTLGRSIFSGILTEFYLFYQ